MLAKYMAFPAIVSWLEAAAVAVSLYHTLWLGTAAKAAAPVD